MRFLRIYRRTVLPLGSYRRSMEKSEWGGISRTINVGAVLTATNGHRYELRKDGSMKRRRRWWD